MNAVSDPLAPVIVAPGIYHGMPAPDYWSIDAVNWSSLKHMDDSPKHYLHAMANPMQSTPAMLLGTRFHCALLEPHRFASAYVVLPANHPRRPTSAQWNAKKPSPESAAAMEWWSQWEASNAGRECIEAHEYDLAQAMADEVRRNRDIAPYLTAAVMTESVLVWRDPLTGLLCKARPDLVCERADGKLVLLDPKSCRTTEPRMFGQHASKLGYHCQLAHYKNGLAELDVRVEASGLIGCESLAPHDTGLFWADESTEALAAEQVEKLLARLAECRESGRWPGRNEGEQMLQMPAYLFSDYDNADALGLTFGES